MTDQELAQLKRDAKRYRFMKTSDSGELGFSQQCTLLALESDKWDKVIDKQLKQMEGDSRFKVGETVFYTNCHPNQPDWIKAHFIQQANVVKFWQPESCSAPVYQLRLLNSSIKVQSQESQLSALTPSSKAASYPWGKIAVEAKATDGLMLKLLQVNDANALLDELLELLKLEAIEYKQCRKDLHLLIRSSSPYVNIKLGYREKPTFMLNGRRSNKDCVLSALSELEHKR